MSWSQQHRFQYAEWEGLASRTSVSLVLELHERHAFADGALAFCEASQLA